MVLTGLEPLVAKAAASAVSPIVKSTVEAGQSRLKQAAETKANDAALTIAYLETANEIMAALEAEATLVLLAAMDIGINPVDPDEAVLRALLARLRILLHLEILRPALAQMRGRLEVCIANLEEDSTRFFGTMRPNETKTEILHLLKERVDAIKEYEGVLEQGDPRSPYRGSAPYIDQMMRLENALENRNPQEVQQAAQEARETVYYEPRRAVTRSAEIGTLVEMIRKELG